MADSAALKSVVDLHVVHSHSTDESIAAPFVSNDDRKDHFIMKNGVRCAGSHLIIDLYDASRLDDIEHMKAALIECVEQCGATLLHIHLHPFEPNGGISGVAVLAESHISVHTWPECNYAAFDVFMCGDAQPIKSVEVLKAAFKPERLIVNEFMRGQAV